MLRPALHAVGFCAFLFAAAGSARGDVKTWKNAASGDWFTAANWMGGVPGAADDGRIEKGGAAYTVRMNGDVTINELILDSVDATLFAGARTITLTETARVFRGNVQFISSTMTHNSPAATAALSSDANFVMKGTSEYKGVNAGNEVTNIGSHGVFTVMGTKNGNNVLPAAFTLRGGVFNSKSVVLNSTEDTSATLNLTRMVNYEKAELVFRKGAGGARTLKAELFNLGDVKVETTATVTNATAEPSTNGGTITIAKDTVLTHTGKFNNEYVERDMGGNVVKVHKGSLAGEGVFAIKKADFGAQGKFDPKKVRFLGPGGDGVRGGPDDVATLTIDTEDLALVEDAEFAVDLASFGNDVLAVTGSASAYNSLLDIRLLDGFVPFVGQSFTVMTFAPSDPLGFTFTLNQPAGIHFDVLVSSTSVVLTTVAVPVPGAGVALVMVGLGLGARRRR